jgi:HK97 family phage major capsid protein
MEQLAAEYHSLNASYEAIQQRCASENRDPTTAEYGQMQELRAMSDRLVELREVEDRKSAGVRFMDRATPAGPSSGLVHVRAEAMTYRPPDAAGPHPRFFADLLHATIDHDPECRARIDRHKLETRAAATTATGAGVIPPTWLFNEFAILAHGNRPWADQLRKVPIENANPVNIGVQVTPGAAPAAQASENAAPADGSFNANILTTNPVTYTGKVDVSRQVVDGSNPAIDGIIYADSMGAYNEAIEQAVVNALEALTPPVIITYPGTYTNLPDAFIDAATSLAKRRKLPATTVLLSAGAWAFVGKQKDTAGRPLITTGTYGPTNSYGVAQVTQYQQLAGEVAGLLVVPSWAGVDNHLYVVRSDDLLLLESPTFNFRYEEVLGPSTIRLGVWGYAAPVLGRYPSAITRINSGTTIPAPALADEEPPVEGAGTGGGPGTPKARR